jgi:hypothetical protein
MTLSGHKTSLVGAYFSHCNPNEKITSCYTISQDGALVTWECNYNEEESIMEEESKEDRAVNFFSGTASTTEFDS